MKESLSVRFLYGTVFGRFLLKIFTQPFISEIGGWYLSLPVSRHLIPKFIKKNNISLNGIEVPNRGFRSFNDFFKRKKIEIAIKENSKYFISPCDGLLSMIKLSRDSEFNIKNTTYSLDRLLKDSNLAKEFSEGTALILRLTPSHYHRYLFIDSGTVLENRKINGVLHCVRPIALEKFPVFVENAREYTVIDTENFGKIIQMEIGAIMVGKITNKEIKDKVKRGEEKGYFEFGGSTIIVLVKKDIIKLQYDILKELCTGTEVSVKSGEVIAIGYGGTE